MLPVGTEPFAPPMLWSAPFVVLLLCIAVLPLIPRVASFWEHNRNKLLVAGVLAIATLAHYGTRDHGFGHGEYATEPGAATVLVVLRHAILGDFVPFIVLLFSLYVISGGIRFTGDVPATPRANTILLAIGGLLASLVGTTGASILLIRPLLQINSQRKNVAHTVVFFIFVVSNVGGLLLPVGDPPLFLGYLRGVPFLWTLHLAPEWAFCTVALLAIYYAWDRRAYRKEAPADLVRDATDTRDFALFGASNFAYLAGVILAVGLLVPGERLAGTQWIVPPYLREGVQLAFAALSLRTTPKKIRVDNGFNFTAIGEVAALFIGIFICMQVPIEILQARGAELGLTEPWQFFWASGGLSSFLDNAPTYAVYFETAGALHVPGTDAITGVKTASGSIPVDLLRALSLGSVLMGANTYIGNGPNFMVKSIAEQSGIKMPSFFGYMGYSLAILIPLFVLVTLLFL